MTTPAKNFENRFSPLVQEFTAALEKDQLLNHEMRRKIPRLITTFGSLDALNETLDKAWAKAEADESIRDPPEYVRGALRAEMAGGSRGR